jgi:hypothetical protein
VNILYLYVAAISPMFSNYCLLYLFSLVSILLVASSLSMVIPFHAHLPPVTPPIIYLVFVILSLPILAHRSLTNGTTTLMKKINRSSPLPRRLTGVGGTLADVPTTPAPRQFLGRHGPRLTLVLSQICSIICLGFEAAARALSRAESASSTMHSLDWLEYFLCLLWICFSIASLGCTCHHTLLQLLSE